MKQRRYFVFCTSFMDMPFALLLWKNGRNRVTVITQFPGADHFFRGLGVESHLVPQLGVPARFRDKWKACATLKKHLDALISGLDVQPGDLFLNFGNGCFYTQIMAYCYKLFSKRCRCLHMLLHDPHFSDNWTDMKPYDLFRMGDKNYATMFWQRLAVMFSMGLRLDIKLFQMPFLQKTVLRMGEAFFRRYGIKVSHKVNPYALKLASIHRFTALHDRAPDILALDYEFTFCRRLWGRTPEAVQANKAVFEKVFALLKKATPSLAMKYHPEVLYAKYGREVPDPEGIPLLPAYLPSDYLVPAVRRMVLGVCSSTLKLMGEAHGAKAVSIMELLTWDAEEEKRGVRTMLSMSARNPVHFVRSFEELESLLAETATTAASRPVTAPGPAAASPESA